MNTLRRILVATDFSPAGHAAVARAGQLAEQYNAQLTVFHATPDWRLFSHQGTGRQEHYAGITRNADELMRGEISWLGEQYQLTARAEIHQDRATPAITRAIQTFQPDLLVIGAEGEHALPGGGAALGGTALKLIARDGVPLLLVRKPEAPVYRSTLAAVIGGFHTAHRLVDWAGALAGSGTCHVVRAYDVPYLDRMQLWRLDDAAIAACAEEQRRLAQQDCDTLERTVQPGTQIAIHVVRGAALPTILEQITRYAPQLVVIGQHQRLADEHPTAWATSVGTRLAYRCPTDVLMIPETSGPRHPFAVVRATDGG